MVDDRWTGHAWWTTGTSQLADPHQDLEVWVDAADEPTTVHLAGVLDRRTGTDVCAVVDELLREGCRNLLVDAGGLVVPDAEGMQALGDIERAVRGRGGTLSWWP